MKKLSELKTGETAIIKEFVNDEVYVKLMEMGCIPGEVIRMEQKGLFGDPVSVTVVGYNLSLRLNEADEILVDIINEQ